jgi:hydroxymethylpyrimidine pyrophosphatase-like HAD family hydrolase
MIFNNTDFTLDHFSIIVNGSAITDDEIKQIIQTLSNKKKVTETGGYLFKFSKIKKNITFAIVPYHENGMRNYHYNMTFKVKDSYYISGFINTSFSITFLFGNKKHFNVTQLNEEIKNIYMTRFVFFAQFLIFCGFITDFKLDILTIQIIQKLISIEAVPNTIQDLANYVI